MRIGPLRSYAPTIRRKLLLGSVYSSITMSTLFPGAALAGDFTQSLYRNGVTGQDVASIASIPGWNFTRASAGYAEGTTTEVVTNKLTIYNANPQEAVGFVGNPLGMTKSGDAAGVLSVVDDSAALAAAGLNILATSGKVYKLDNTAGTASALVNLSGPYGNTNAHSMSVWVRGSGNLFLRDSGNGNQVGPLTIGSTYTRFTNVNIIGGLITRMMQITVGAGGVAYFILPQFIERTNVIPQEIITAGASASFNYGQADTLKQFASGEPRITSKGLFVEEARTNNALYSDTPGIGASWSTAGGASTPIDAPTGAPAGAARFRDTGGTLGHRPSQTVTLTIGQAHTISCYVRYGSYQWTRITSAASNEQVTAVFDVVNKTVSAVGFITGAPTGVSAQITRLGVTDWYRCSLTFTPSVGGSSTVLCGHASDGTLANAATAYAGSTANYTDYFGFQVEVGAFPTSYIPTTTAAATRAADVAYISGLGYILGQFRNNKVAIYNANPVDTTGLTLLGDAGATLTVVNDPTSIANAGLSAICTSGNIYKIDNTLGTNPANVVLNGTIGATTQHAASVYAMGGAGVVGVGNSTGGYTNSFAQSFAASGSFVRRSFSTTSDATNRQMIIRANAGQVVYFILPQLEEGSTVSDPIITTGAPVLAGSPFTIAISAEIPSLDGIGVYLCSLAQGTSSNERIVIDKVSTNISRCLIITGGVSQPSVGSATKLGARVLKDATRTRGTEQRNAFDGVLANTSVTSPAVKLDTINLGVNQVRSGSWLNGYLQKFAIFGDVDDAKLQSLTA